MIDNAIKVLNEALKLDPEAINAIFAHRVPCNEAISAHPTIQVGDIDMSVLGLINGMFGVNAEGWGHITMVVDNDKIVEFIKTQATSKK